MHPVVLAGFLLALAVAAILIALGLTILAIFNMAAASVANDEEIKDLLEEEQVDGEQAIREVEAVRLRHLELQNGPVPTLAEGEDPYVAGLALYETKPGRS